MVYSWRKSSALKELVGARCNLRKFKKHWKMFQHPLIQCRGYKILIVPPYVAGPAPHRSIRACHTTEKFTLLTTEQRDVLLDNDEPMTYMKATMGPESEKWLGAMDSEIEFIHDNQVWNMVDPINGVRPIDCKWVFKKKMDKDKKVHIYKARMVAKGFK
jgi:hypothetical protein